MQDIIEQTISAADNNERRYITDTNKREQEGEQAERRFDGVNASF